VGVLRQLSSRPSCAGPSARGSRPAAESGPHVLGVSVGDPAPHGGHGGELGPLHAGSSPNTSWTRSRACAVPHSSTVLQSSDVREAKTPKVPAPVYVNTGPLLPPAERVRNRSRRVDRRRSHQEDQTRSTGRACGVLVQGLDHDVVERRAVSYLRFSWTERQNSLVAAGGEGHDACDQSQRRAAARSPELALGGWPALRAAHCAVTTTPVSGVASPGTTELDDRAAGQEGASVRSLVAVPAWLRVLALVSGEPGASGDHAAADARSCPSFVDERIEVLGA
jgi:hypothetical protein